MLTEELDRTKLILEIANNIFSNIKPKQQKYTIKHK